MKRFWDNYESNTTSSDIEDSEYKGYNPPSEEGKRKSGKVVELERYIGKAEVEGVPFEEVHTEPDVPYNYHLWRRLVTGEQEFQ